MNRLLPGTWEKVKRTIAAIEVAGRGTPLARRMARDLLSALQPFEVAELRRRYEAEQKK